MKRPVALFICVIILASSMLANYGVLLGVQKQVANYREFIRERIDGLQKTDLIVLTASQYQALEKSRNGNVKEFNWQGHRFDVLNTEFRDGKVFLSCYNDRKEENLLEKSATVAAGFGSNDDQKNLPTTLKLKVPDFFFQKSADFIHSAFTAEPLVSLFQLHAAQGNFYLHQSPPPRA